VLWEARELIWYGDQVTRRVTEESGFDRWQRTESPLYSPRTGSGAHPSAHLVGMEDKPAVAFRQPPQFSAKNKNTWGYTATTPCILMSWRSTEDRQTPAAYLQLAQTAVNSLLLLQS